MSDGRTAGLRVSRSGLLALAVLAGLAGILLWAVAASGTQPYESFEEAVATDGPVAQFRFDDASGSGTIADSAGSYTATNSKISLGGEGPFGGARSGLFGGEAYASLPSSPLAGANAFTVEGWVYWTGGSSYEAPVFDFGASTTKYMFLTPASSLSSHKMLFEIRTGASSDVQVTATKLPANKWEYVAVTETGSGTLTLYLNGEQVGQTTGATLFPASVGSVANDYLGKSQVSSAPLFGGSMSNVAFYGSALSAERVKTHYDAGEYAVNAEAPTISGTAKDGSTLTAKAGSWTGLTPITFGYQWMLCNSTGGSCAGIPEALEAKYALGHEDVGKTLKVAVNGSNSAGSSTATSTQSAVVAPLAPSNTVLPVVSGTVEQGQLLSVNSGTWEGTPPFAYTYKWNACNSAGEKCKAISGATSSSYRVASAQVGGTLRAAVTAENEAGSKSANSEPTVVATEGPPVNLTLPAVSGTAEEGQTLHTSKGTWAGTEPYSFTYQWELCNSAGESCTGIAGATSSNYSLTANDVGDTLRAVLTAKNSVGSTSATSLPSPVIDGRPENTTPPAISGTARDGQTLSGSTGAWTGYPSPSYSYQWQRCNSSGESCTNISGATSTTYSLGHGDVGTTLRIKVTASNSGGSASSTSEASGVVAALAPSNTERPTVTGTAKDGETLSASTGEWAGTPSLTYTYQWQTCDSLGEACMDVSGATSSTYVLGHGDVGTTLRVVVKAANSVGSTSATSEATAVVVALAPSGTAAPSISGEAVEDQTLSASMGTWEGTPSISYAYQWQRCNSSGGSCGNISGATGSTYVLGHSDVGSTVRVVVTASNAAGSASADSAVTDTVIDPHCTVTWTGAAGDGLWETAANWSTTSVPASSDQACLPSGATVHVNSGDNRVGSIEGEGSLVLEGGVLELADESVTSHVAGLSIPFWGVLTGPGTLEVTSSFYWGARSTMSGSGRTVLGPKVSGSIYFGSYGTLDKRTLVNEGSLEMRPGTLDGENGAVFENKGTFDDVSDGTIFAATGGAEPRIENTGTFEKTVETGTSTVGVEFNNGGAVVSEAGSLELTGGGVPEQAATGSWGTKGEGTVAFDAGSFSLGSGVELSGPSVEVSGATVVAQDIQGPAATLTMTAGSLELTGATTSHVAGLSIPFWGVLTGPGTLEVTSSFYWGARSTMSGSGRTVLGPKVSGSIYFGSYGTLDKRTLVNEGSLEMRPGTLDGENGAVFENKGTFDDVSDGTIFAATGGAEPRIENTGTFEKTVETGTSTVGVEFNNGGAVVSEAGSLELTGGGVPEQAATGSWGTKGEGTVAFDAGSFSLGSGVELSGPSVEVSGATVVAQDIQGPAATLTMTAGSLELTGATTSHVAGLSIPFWGVLTGPGTLEVTSSFYWGARSTMSGSGRTVLGPKVSGSIYFGSYGTLDKRTLVNEGSLEMRPGTLDGENGAVFENKGTFDDVSDGTIFAATGGAEPRIENTGTFEKTVETGTSTVGVEFNNGGAVVSEAGSLELTGGGVPEQAATGSWGTKGEGTVAFDAGSFSLGSGVELSGPSVEVSGATVVAQDIQGPAATLTMTAGSLELTGATTSHVAGLSIPFGGVLTGPGTLEVTSSFYWGARSTMSGSGRTVLGPKVSGSIYFGSYGTLDKRTLVNEGSLEMRPGTLDGENGAVFENKGTFDDVSDGTIFAATGGAEPRIENTGTFEKTVETGTSTVGVEFNNGGAVVSEAGSLELTGGGVPEQAATGSWGTKGEASIGLKPGTFLVQDGVELNARDEGATIIWVEAHLQGSLEPRPYASGTVAISGSGEAGVAGPFSDATVEVMPPGATEWEALCGPIAPGFAGEFSCAWNTASGGYPDGSYQLRAKLIGGAISPVETVLTPVTTVLVDNTAPTGSVTVPSHDVGGSPVITGTASDSGSGVQSWQLQIAVEGGSEWTNACPLQSSPISGESYGCTVNTASYTDGAYEMRALIADRTGNIYTTPTVSLGIDNTAPSGTLDSLETYVRHKVELAGSGSSTGSTVASWSVQIAPAGTSSWVSACPPQHTPISGTEYRCEMATSVFPDGKYDLRAIVTDEAGGIYTTQSRWTTIDNTPPVGSLNALPEKVIGDIGVQGWAFDEGSGVASWTLQIAPAGSETFEQACLPQSVPTVGLEYECSVDTGLLATGSYQFRAVIVDNLGNTYTTPTVSTTVESTLLSSAAAPTISGEPISGYALSASSGRWNATGSLSYAYQWQDCNATGEGCTNIEGATARSYLLAEEDVGKTVRLVVTASNGSEELTATSSPSAVIGPNALSNVLAPVIGGSAQVGATLNADPGSWLGLGPISYAYQWRLCDASGGECANIEGATKQDYTPVEEDISKTTRVVVTATNIEGSASETSVATAAIGSASSSSGIRYLYDEAGRLELVDDPSQGAALYRWDTDGNLLSIQRYGQSTLAVLAVRPRHGPPGTQVDITGTDFSTNASEDEVSFDGVSATVSKATTTDLIVTVPEGAGTGAITVTLAGRSAESPGGFAPDGVRAHLPSGGVLHLPTALGSIASEGSAPANSQTNAAPTTAGTAPQASSQPWTPQAGRAKKVCSQPWSSGRKRSCVQVKRAHRATKHDYRPKKKSAKRAKSAAARSHHRGKPQMHHASRTVPAVAPSHTARTAANTDPGSATSASRAVTQTPSGSQDGTAIPTAISDYHSPYHPSWTPAAKNRIGGDWETRRRTSPWASLPDLASPRVTTGLTGQALVINGMPLANVTLAVQGTSKQTRTDSTGRFLLEDLPTGHQVLVIDGESADSKGQRYGRFTVGVELVKGKTSQLGYTIWMTPLDPAGNRTITANLKRETVLTNPSIPGLEVRMPAGTAVHSANGSVVHHLNLTAVPIDRPPFPLPQFVTGVPAYFTVQPGGAYLSKGAQIIYPNWGHLPPGQRMEFWNYDPTSRGWYVYGKGSVSPDGKQVIPDPDVRIWEFTGAMVSSSSGPPPAGPPSGAGSGGGDPVDLATGLFVYQHTDLDLPDAAMPFALTRTYRPDDESSYAFGAGTTDPFELRLWSTENYKNAYLVLPNGGKVKLHRTSSGTGFVEAVYEAVETPGEWQGAVMHYTSGAGWTLTRRDGMRFIFGDLAPLEAIEDRNGNRITLVRQNAADEGGVGALGPVVQIRAPHGHWIDLSYDGDNRIIRATDNAGQTVKYRYDSSGRLEQAIDPEGRTTRYAYDSAGDMTSVTDARGDVLIANTYEAGKVKTQTLGERGTYSFAYHEGSGAGTNSTQLVDPDGHEKVVYWNATTHWPESERVGSELTSYRRDASGNVVHVTASSGDTSYSYNPVGDATSIEREAPGLAPLITSFTYNAYSERTSMTTPLGQTTSYTYDINGNLIAEIDPTGRQTRFGYDSVGEPTSVTNPNGDTTSYAYDDKGNRVAVTDPLGRETQFTYDALGLPVGVRDPEGGLTQLTYDKDNELLGETDPADDTTSYSYDADGNLIQVTDPRGHTQTETYDARDRLTAWTNALGKTTSYTYDPLGDLIGVTDPNGQTTSYSYDAQNRLSLAAFGAVEGGSPSSTIAYDYNGAGDLTSMVDSRYGTQTMSYDGYNRLAGENGPNGSVGYSYNADGERESMTIGGEEAASYSYNPDGQLSGIGTPNGSVSLVYGEDGLPTQVRLPDSDTENYSYNAASELTGIVYKNPVGTKLGNLAYGRDALGRVTTISGSYARTSLPESVSEASYNSDNELTSLEGHALSYDADGSLTSNGTSSFEWNDRNQLTGVTRGSEKWSFAYDPFARRASKTANGTTTSYLYDGQNIAAETDEGKTAQLVNGLGLDKRYARTTSAGTDSYLTDDLGSTIALSNGSGEPATDYTYGPFGSATGTGAESSNPYQYTGRENDGDGLQYNRARYYSPGTGTFISQDSLGIMGGGINLYRYVEDSPTNAIDPKGLKTIYNPIETVPRGECEAEKKAYEGTSEDMSGSCSPSEISRSVEAGLCTAGTTVAPLPGNPLVKIVEGEALKGACEATFPPEKRGGGGSGAPGGSGSGVGGPGGSG